jgi:hypothetical protein
MGAERRESWLTARLIACLPPDDGGNGFGAGRSSLNRQPTGNDASLGAVTTWN